MTEPDPWTIDPSRPAPLRPLRHANDLWVLTKQIDELGGEWTFSIFMNRAFNFHFGRRRPMFYEPIGEFDRLGLEALLIQKANAYCPSPQPGDLGVDVNVFSSIFGAAGKLIPMPEKDEASIGRHSMAIIGVEDRNTLVVRNSWSGWRGNNFAFLSREYFESHAAEAMLSRLWDFGPDDSTADRLLRCEDKDEFARLWRRRTKSGTNNKVATLHSARLKWYACWSMQDEAPAEVLTLELDRQILVGTAVIVHRVYEATSEVSDLFVWPSYRRKGYGLLLERFAAERATVAGSKQMGVYVWNSDAIKGKNRALEFLRAASYADIEEATDRQFIIYAKRSVS